MISKTTLKAAVLSVIVFPLILTGCDSSSDSVETENGTETFKQIDENRLALHKGLQAFYEGDYETTIEKSLEVIEKDPDNVLAYKRLGSAYYALGEKENALKSWERAIEIAPDDEDLKTYISRVRAGRSNIKE